MLADFLTMHEHTRQALRRARLRVRRRRPLQHGPLAAGHRARSWAADVRHRHARASCGRPRTSSTLAHELAAGVRRAHHDHRRHRRASTASTSSTPTSGSRWASRRRSGRSARELLAPVPGQRRAARRDRQPEVKFMHCLPGIPRRRDHGRRARSPSATGMTRRPRGHRRGVPRPRRASSSTRPRTACTRSRPSSSPRSPERRALGTRPEMPTRGRYSRLTLRGVRGAGE